MGGGWSGRKESRGRRGASCSPPPRASAAARLVTAAPTGRLRTRRPPLTCRRRLWAALTGAALVRDRGCGAAAASAAPRARRPAPWAQAPAAAAAAALRPPPPEQGSPRRGMQKEPDAGLARGSSNEQAAEALKAAVQPSEYRAQQIASDSRSPSLKNRHFSRSPRPPCSPPRPPPPPPPPPARGTAPFAPRPAPPRPFPAARLPARRASPAGSGRPGRRDPVPASSDSAPPARRACRACRARRARSLPAPSAGCRPAPARVLTKCGKGGPNSSPPVSTPPRPSPVLPSGRSSHCCREAASNPRALAARPPGLPPPAVLYLSGKVAERREALRTGRSRLRACPSTRVFCYFERDISRRPRFLFCKIGRWLPR